MDVAMILILTSLQTIGRTKCGETYLRGNGFYFWFNINFHINSFVFDYTQIEINIYRCSTIDDVIKTNLVDGISSLKTNLIYTILMNNVGIMLI